MSALTSEIEFRGDIRGVGGLLGLGLGTDLNSAGLVTFREMKSLDLDDALPENRLSTWVWLCRGTQTIHLSMAGIWIMRLRDCGSQRGRGGRVGGLRALVRVEVGKRSRGGAWVTGDGQVAVARRTGPWAQHGVIRWSGEAGAGGRRCSWYVHGRVVAGLACGRASGGVVECGAEGIERVLETAQNAGCSNYGHPGSRSNNALAARRGDGHTNGGWLRLGGVCCTNSPSP